MIRFLAVVLAASTLLAPIAAAHATMLTIGLQEPGVNSGAITNEASGPGAASSENASYGTFSAVAISAAFNPLPGVLFRDSIALTAATSGALEVYLTEQGVTAAGGFASVFASLAATLLPAGWTVTESTYFDPTDGVFQTASPDKLNTIDFASDATAYQSVSADTGMGPFSLTELYTITVGPGASAGNPVVLTTNVPEPGALALFGAGLAGLALARLRLKDVAAA